jgi:hypothetical protein
MNRRFPFLALAAACTSIALGACGDPAVKTAEEMNASYERALERTAAVAVELPGGDAGARQALAGAEGFFSDMTVAVIRARTAATYAPDAYLNDNLAIVEGAPAIADYFARTAGRVSGLRVSFLDITHTGVDYFVRWRMSVESPRLNDGAPMVSYGVTHFRFDAGGRILVHKDFWDAGTGLYEYIPGLRSLTRRVRAAAEND